MTYYAHLSDDGRVQTVTEHLQNTAAICKEYASSFGDGDQGMLIGLAHDIGKYSDEFQRRLHGGHVVDHTSAGALECAKLKLPWAACCVAGHHGGLPDVGNGKFDMSDDPTLFGRIKKAIEGKIPSYHQPAPLMTVADPSGYGKDYLIDSFIIRMLYSCLVDADYLDTEQFMSDGSIQRDSGNSIPELLAMLNRFIAPWWSPTSELNRKRCEILRACIDGGSDSRGLYSLTVPTGGGKTIASMAFALNHAAKHGMDRVIYVIPYTSIIEQNAKVFRDIFGERNVVEHHSNADLEVRDTDSNVRYSQIKATENWDAPIIVTTAVQFFESLYANRPSKCRKLHSIANSVIIFDEAQMLPTEHLRPCVAAIAELVALFRSTAVLCTATQPVLNDLFAEFAPGIQPKELCPGTRELFDRFRRVRYENIGAVEINALADRLTKLPQVLCIVNSRKSAQAVYRLLPYEGSYHLSTLMYPAHRQAILSEIRHRLSAGLPCRVVSTSLIEAGVDVDFPVVFRELAGLDSILQAGGRCNREGKRSPEDSVVTVFEGVSLTPQMLRINIGATKETLRPGVDPADPDTVTHYFSVYRSLLATSTLDRAQVITAFTHGIQGRILPFRTVAERFHLINEDTQTVYIPIGEGAGLVQRLQCGERSRDLYRKLGRYGVNIYDKHFAALKGQGALAMLDEGSAVLTDTSLYRSDIGLIMDDEAQTALFV